MAFPTTLSRGDSKLRVWKKTLAKLQSLAGAGASANNDPKPADGLRRTKQKVLRSLRGATAGG